MCAPAAEAVPLRTIALHWTRIGVTGFGGPPTHIALLRRLVVEQRHWVDQHEFEDALAACNLLPGPASTQLSIFLARRVGGPPRCGGRRARLHPAGGDPDHRAVSRVLRRDPAGVGSRRGARAPAPRWPRWRSRAGVDLAGPSLERTASRPRWLAYVVLGAAAAALVGAYLVLVLLACGLLELGASPAA